MNIVANAASSKMTRVVVLLSIALSVALGVTAFAAPPATQPDPPGATSRPALAKQTITLTTADGVKISATFHATATSPGEKRPAIIMLHGSNRTKERWEQTGVISELAEDRYHFLALDIRGRGASESGDAEALRRNPGIAVHDLDAAMEWIKGQPNVDAKRIAMMGSSYGANLVCAGCLTQSWNVKTVVCFSATAASYRFLPAFEGRSKIASGLYLVGSEEPLRYDVAATAKRLAEDTEGESQIKTYMGRVHALGIWERFSESHTLVRDWLRKELKDKE